MKKILSLATVYLILTNTVLAHGENKFGPHEGYIRMPGSYHTELVQSHDDSFSVYLMDVNNKNPEVKNSSVKLTYINKNKSISFTCFPIDDHFSCKPDEKINSIKGKLIINAIRLNVKSNDAIYELPLKLAGDEKKHDMSKM